MHVRWVSMEGLEICICKTSSSLTMRTVYIMNNGKANDLWYCPKETLQSAENGESGPVFRECCAQDHKHGDHLGPNPDGESFYQRCSPLVSRHASICSGTSLILLTDRKLRSMARQECRQTLEARCHSSYWSRSA